MSNGTIFLRAGNTFHLRHGTPSEYPSLPPGTYTVDACPDAGLHLAVADDVGAPGKLYGAIERRASRVLNSFKAREGITTGVLLTGQKGTGKTLLAKRIIELGRTQHNLPTLLVNAPFGGTKFMQFLNDISQPAIIFIDEAEKIYNNPEKQNGLLSILDGCYSGHKLFVFVVNQNKLVDTLTNRPGRIHYRWTYERLEQDVVVNYALDTLRNRAHLSGLMRTMLTVQYCTFDVLKGLVWEMNQYDEPAHEAIQNLNIDFDENIICKIQVRAVAGPLQSRGMMECEGVLNRQGESVHTALHVYPARDFTDEQCELVRAYATAHELYHQAQEVPSIYTGRSPARSTLPNNVDIRQGLTRPPEAMLKLVRPYFKDPQAYEQFEELMRCVTFKLTPEDLVEEDHYHNKAVYHQGDYVVEVTFSAAARTNTQVAQQEQFELSRFPHAVPQQLSQRSLSPNSSFAPTGGPQLPF